MLKKFVPITADESPSKNPYEVRTFIGDTVRAKPEWKAEPCSCEIRKCPQNNTIAKVLTIEDEIKRLHQKAEQSRFQRPFKAFCAREDEYLTCIVPQRTPQELRTHAVMRENYLRTKRDLATRFHDATHKQAKPKNILELESPVAATEEEEEQAQTEEEDEEEEKRSVKPQLATPSCSVDAIYEPTDRILELTRPSSGWFHNETSPPEFIEDGINYSVYNPRILQEQMDAQRLGRYDLIQGKTPLDLWTWNIGKQERDSELDRETKGALVCKFSCDHLELKVYTIPRELDKTFKVEIVFGDFAVQPEKPTRHTQHYYRPPEMAYIYVAFVERFRLNPDFWTADSMNMIQTVADKLHKRSVYLNYKSEDTDFDIVLQIPERNAEIAIRTHFTGPIRAEPNIYKALTLYFSKYNAAVLCSKTLFLLIWKRCSKSFYIFDPNGRNENCERDFEGGKCSLMCVNHVEHLVYLIMNCSQADLNSDYNLYEVSLVNFGKILNPIPTKPFPKTVRRLWTVVNAHYALIPAANSGLQQSNTGNEQNASMIISLLALLYADIERGQLWTPEVLDELNKFGQNYFKNLSKRLKMKKNQQLNIMDLPERIMMGSHKATLKKRPFLYTGHVADCRDHNDSQLKLALQDLFSSNWDGGLLQIDNLVIALWRDRDLYYAFDPFRRGRVGQVMDPDDYRTKGVACLQMHTNFDSLCRTLYDKAILMRRGGKFFLHGINVGCIKPLAAAAHLPNRYPRLKLNYPTFGDADTEDAEGDSKPKKKGKVDRVASIKSLPEEERLPEYTTSDLVNGMLEEYLCELISALPEPEPRRSRLYKQAERVLLRSDRPYLDKLKYNLKHNLDEDNIYAKQQTHQDPPTPPLTLEEELRVPNNFEMLPDGTWVIFSITELPIMEEDSAKLGGLLANIVAASVSAKYKISTWNAELIEYAITSVNNFDEEFKNYEHTLSALLDQKLPRISIGKNTYDIEVEKVTHANQASSLRQMLLQSLICYNRLMVICQRFSCVIFKRYNFLYMFIGFACNPVGYRKFGGGPACLLRFIELDALLRRIEFGCDPHGCEITNYVAVALKVRDVTTEPPERYRLMMPKDERDLYTSERQRIESERKRKMDKKRFLDDELRKENRRIERFLAQKKKREEERAKAKEERAKRKGRGRKAKAASLETEGEIEMETEGIPEGEAEEEEEIALKHKRGKKLPREILGETLPRPVLYGYHLRNKDCLYKLQGTIALDNREEASLELIKPCFFVSTAAVLFAVMRPLNQWPPSRVDRVVNCGVTIASRSSNMTTAFERVIKNITADDYSFDIWVKTFDPQVLQNLSLRRKLERAFTTRRYLLLQTSNCTYAIYHDEYYHLFDPYGSMNIINEDEEEEEESKKRKIRGIKKYCERNTASWVLFAEIQEMLNYIDKRAANPDWRKMGEFEFHIIDIISHKKAEPKERIVQLLTDMEVSPTCGKYQEEAHICSRGETLAWLDLDSCLPVWSRLNRRNTAGRDRNIALTKHRKYDIEIDKRLWSLWGSLSPYASVFSPSSRGRQFLACNVIACMAAKMYRLDDWSPQLMDNIIINGDRYHCDSLANIQRSDYEFSLEDLGTECQLEELKFAVHLEFVAYGMLYCRPTRKRMNLADALMYFFTKYNAGILQCKKRSLAIGRSLGYAGGYYMFDCQSREHPLFPKGQGAPYLLRTTHLQVLLYCIVVTLNVPFYNVPFSLHKVAMLREGALIEEAEEE